MNIVKVTPSQPTRSATDGSRTRRASGIRLFPALAAGALLVGVALVGTSAVNAAIVPTINLATAGDYSVLGGQTVTNTGPSTLAQNLGVSPGSAITGFPPGLASGTTHIADGPAAQAQLDLTTAYNEAAGRPVNEITAVDLTGRTLVGGVYASDLGPLELSGALVLDGQGDPNSVFIFKSASTLTTGSASSVTMINGAQECNVFWQVGSSATLGTGSTFRGNILALTSIGVNTGVTVYGRALARNGEVTLDTDVFVAPLCNLTASTTTVSGANTTVGGANTTVGGANTTVGGATTTVVLPSTGNTTGGLPSIAALFLVGGFAIALIARRSPARER